MDKFEKKVTALLNEGVGSSGCLMMRLPLPDSVEILKWVDENIPENFIITPEREIHITVLYGIKDTVPVSTIKDFVEKLPYVVVQAENIEFFKQPDQDVAHIKLNSPQLVNINKQLVEYLGEENITPSKYDYNPHITLAYIKSNSVPHIEGNSRFNGYTYLLKEFVYSEPGSVAKHSFKLSN